MIIYVVKPGDSLYSISQRYGIAVDKIASDNQLANPERLVTGQTLVLMTDSIPHTVARGQSLYTIALDYGVSLDALRRANPEITNASMLMPGQVIRVPVPSEKLGMIYVNGYAFPNISRQVLESTLPNLTYLSIFSYQVLPDVTLMPIDDGALIQQARAAGVAPMMVITNIQQGGGFSSQLAHTILTSEALQNTLLDHVVRTMQQKNYYGLDVDFEYIYPEDRENYNAFIRKTAARIHPLGYTLTTALAPKLSGNQQGLLYQAHDYPVHGTVADHVILMTYEWGYTYGPARAVAPLNEVKRVLDYAVTVIPPRKILMGIPNYGYDWTLPFVQGSAARTISNPEAVNLAARVGANIQYDAKSASPFFTYYQDGKRHEVWFEDARSIRAKLLLVDQYGLGGVSYWTINRFFPQNWLILQSMYNVRKLPLS